MDDSKKKWIGWIVLAAIVVAAGVALVFTNGITETPVIDTDLAKNETAIRSLYPDADKGEEGFERITVEENSTLKFAYRVKQNGKDAGVVYMTATQGYGGPVEVITGTDAHGTIVGIIVGGDEFNETPDLGGKAKEPEFIEQFKQKKPPLELSKDIDAISGATITSRAVVDGVNGGTEAINELTSADNPQQSAENNDARTANASVIGYAGPVLVQLGIDSQGAISSVNIGAERFMETEELGGRTRDGSFTEQFIGKTPPISLDDIDAVSGATVTSQAVVDAVNEAYEFLNP